MKKTFLTTVAILALAGGALADPAQRTIVKTHPSQGEVAQVTDASAALLTHDDGLFVAFDTNGLTAGHVHTLWLVVINNPAGCYDEDAAAAGQKADPADCNSRDVLKRGDVVGSDVGYAGGVIVGDDGTAAFAFHQPEGPLTNGWFGRGLKASDSAEIHLVVNDHGPLIAGEEREMLSSYRHGCADESIPAPMPATARADGEAGPNTCRLVQTAVFKLSAADS